MAPRPVFLFTCILSVPALLLGAGCSKKESEASRVETSAAARDNPANDDASQATAEHSQVAEKKLPSLPKTGTSHFLQFPNLASFSAGAVLHSADIPNAWHSLDECPDTSWIRDDGAPDPSATAIIELAARADIKGIRLVFDDYYHTRLPAAVSVSIGSAADGPFTSIAEYRLPDTWQDTGDAPFVAEIPTSTPAQGRYVRLFMRGRRGAPDEALGPQLADLTVHGVFLDEIKTDALVVGKYDAGWLLGTFEIAERNGELWACFERDGRVAPVTLDGRSIQIRFQNQEGTTVAVLVRGPDGQLQGVAQHWNLENKEDAPAVLLVEPLRDGSPICKASSARSDGGIEAQLDKDKRARVYDILFDFGQSQPRPSSKRVLEEVADALQKHPDWKLNIEGHTDNVGDDAANQTLSEQRAAAIVAALVASGIENSRLSSTGLGESKPIATNETTPGRAQNRRVELALR